MDYVAMSDAGRNLKKRQLRIKAIQLLVGYQGIFCVKKHLSYSVND